MKVLVVGGAGYVGSIIRPTVEAAHECFCFDRQPVRDMGERCFVGDVNDDVAVRHAVGGMDAIVYLAMGVRYTPRKDVNDIDLAFGVNVRGAYRFLRASLAAGACRFVYASTMSVYDYPRGQRLVDERVPPDNWVPYGISKRLGESLCQAASQRYPDATIIALRLLAPRNERDFPASNAAHGAKSFHLGPNDTRRLFMAAIHCTRPGAHIVQATGDLEGLDYPNTDATELLGWRAEGN